MNYTEYHNEVRLIAEDVYKLALEAHPEDRDEQDEFVYERVNEVVDGHMWVIYYSYNLSVLQHTANPEAYQDIYSNEDLGSIVSEHGLGGLHSTIVYFAMVADINEAIYDTANKMEM